MQRAEQTFAEHRPVSCPQPEIGPGSTGAVKLARTPRCGLFALLISFSFFVFLGAPSHAKDAETAGLNRLALEVFINDQPTRLIGDIYRAADGRLLASREEMASLGIAPPGKGDKKEMIAFDALPGLSTRYLEAEQKLHLNVPEALRLAREYDVHGTSAPGQSTPAEVSRDFGVVVNYNAYGTLAKGYSGTTRPYTTGTVSLDGRAFSPYGVLQSSSILGTSLAKQGALRLETSYVYADRDSATTTTLGDAISGGLAWSRPVRFGGVQVSRSFGLRPDLVTAPLPSVGGSAAVPSTVDVYVDNMRIASQEVGAGPYRLNNLPVSGENGTARVVVRDITGKETTTSLPFFTSARLLAPGTFDFSLDAGYPRHNYALESFDYSRKLMGQGSLRYGLTERLTLEGHAEGTPRLGLAGGGATFNAGGLGTFSLAGAGSLYNRQSGAMGYAAWQGSLKSLQISASTQRTFGHFTDVAAATAANTGSKVSTNFLDSGFFVLNRSAAVPRAVDRLTIGKMLEPINASVSATFMNVDRGRNDISRLASVTWSQTFAKKYNTFVSVFSDFGTQRQTGVVAGLTFTLGDDILITGSGGASRSERSGSFDVARPLGGKEYDYGWRLYDNESQTSSRGAQVAGKTPYARAAAGVRQDGKTLGGYGELEGSLVASPSGVFAARRIGDAFAIVNVGAPGVEVLHENRPVGRSNMFGKVLVPDVASLQRSKIAIAPESLPGQSHASITETEIMPNFRGSATVNIKTISAKDTARVEIRDAQGQPLPPGTKLVHEQSGHPFTIGYGGQSFLPEIADDNTLNIQIDNRSCTLHFKRSDRQGPKGTVGPLTCTLQ